MQISNLQSQIYNPCLQQAGERQETLESPPVAARNDPFWNQLLVTFLLLFSWGIASQVQAAPLTVRVLDVTGAPASDVAVQVFAGTLDPDSDQEPVFPSSKRSDGLIGFVTGADGTLSLDLPQGTYSIVASSPRNIHRFCLMGVAEAPGSLLLDASQARAITVTAHGREGDTIVGAGIYFRPSRRTRGLTGFIGNDGRLDARISPGRYHVVLVSSSFYYLVQPDFSVGTSDRTLAFDTERMPTADLIIEVPEDAGSSFAVYPNTFPALYEVLETDRTYEYVETIEQQIGYDAAYTDIWSILAFGSPPEENPVTVSVGLTYQLNLSYVVVSARNAPVYAYELRPEPRRYDEQTYRLGNTGREPFDLRIELDRPGTSPTYRPGEQVTVSYRIVDTRGNTMSRLFSFSDARLLFPLVTVTDPDGVVIETNPSSMDFSDHSFPLPMSARQGTYTLEVFLDAQLYGVLRETRTFRVAALSDRTPPDITLIEAPGESELGEIVPITARILDAGGIDSVALILDDLARLPTAVENDDYTWIIQPVKTGTHGWRVEATDRAGNLVQAEGEIAVADRIPPQIELTWPTQIEFGTPQSISVHVTDAGRVDALMLRYRLDGQEETIAGTPVGEMDWRMTLPALRDGSDLQARVEAVDGAGNRADLPGPAEWQTLPLVDTFPPRIHHTEAVTDVPGNRIRVEASLSDNHGLGEVSLHASDASGTAQTFPMSVTDSVATGELPGALAGWEYWIEVSDIPDLAGDVRTTQSSLQHIEPPEVGRVVVLPESSPDAPLTLKAGMVAHFSVQIIDREGNLLDVPVSWLTTGGIGRIRSDGTLQVASVVRGAGHGRVLALPLIGQSDPPILGSADVLVLAGLPHAIAVNPPSASLTAGSELNLLADVFDAHGNLADAPITWDAPAGVRIVEVTELEPGRSSVRVQSLRVGTSRLRATSGAAETTIPLQTTPGRPVSLSVEFPTRNSQPDTLRVVAGEPVTLRAYLEDVGGNRMLAYPEWLLQDDIGRISAAGKFHPTRVGHGQILAIWDGLIRTIEVEVQPGELHRITTEPFIDYLPLSDTFWKRTRQFIAQGWDSEDNPVPIRNLHWTTDPAAGSIDDEGLFTATSEIGDAIIQNVVINGSVFAHGESADGRKLSGKSVVVIQYRPPDPPERIRMVLENFGSPLDSLSLQAGEARRFEVTGFDARNRRWAAQPFWRVEGGIGAMIASGEFRALRPGEGVLVASWLGHSTQLHIRVTPGLLHRLRIRLPHRTLRVGETAYLAVEGYDRLDNRVALDRVVGFEIADRRLQIANLKSQISNLKSQICNLHIEAVSPGFVTLVARVGEIEGYAQVRVLPGDVMALRWEQTIEQIEAGSTFQWRVQASDIKGNPVTAPARWSIEGEIGSISETGLFVASRAGRGRVIAEVAERRLAQTVHVLPGPVIKLDVEPSLLTLTPGMTQPFRAVFEDSEGNRIEAREVHWSLMGSGTISDSRFKIQDSRFNLESQVTVLAETPGVIVLTALGDGMAGQAVALVLSPEQSQPIGLRVVPDLPDPLGQGCTQKFLLWATSGEGKIFPVIGDWRSSDGALLAQPNGVVRSVAEGDAGLLVQYGGLQQSVSIPFADTPFSDATHPAPGIAAAESTGLAGKLVLPTPMTRIPVGVRLPLLAFVERSDGERHRVEPLWETIGAPLRLSEAGTVEGLAPGLAQLRARWGTEQQIWQIEVVPGEAVTMRLTPEWSSFTRFRGIPTLFSPSFWDGQGGQTEAPDLGSLRWLTAGGVGSIDADGRFTPLTGAPQNRHGEVVAHLPERNLSARAIVYLYGTQGTPAELRLEPAEATLFPGEKAGFRALVFDAEGRLLDAPVTWEVRNAQGTLLPGLITPEGQLQIGAEDGESLIGETLHVRASVEALIAESPVKIEMGPPLSLEVTPASPQTLEIGASLRCTAQPRDAHGILMEPDVRWVLSGEMGALTGRTASGVTFRAERAGEGWLTALQAGLSVTVPISVEPGDEVPAVILPQPTYVSPTPEMPGQSTTRPFEIVAGETLTLHLFGDGGIPIEEGVVWRIEPAELGQVSPQGVFHVQRVGAGRLLATTSAGEAAFQILVTPGTLVRIEISPPSASVLTRETLLFSATGWDAEGNPLPIMPRWSVQGGIGSITPEGIFSPFQLPADQNWQGAVIASAEGLAVSARLNITGERGSLARLEILPEVDRAMAGEVVPIRMQGWDSQGNLLPDIVVQLTLAPAVGQLEGLGDSRWIYRAPETLPAQPTVRVEAQSGEIQTSTVLTLVPASPARIYLPAVQTTAGESVSLPLQVFDAFGNPISAADLQLSVTEGTLASEGDSVFYVSTVAGTHTLAASLAQLSASFPLQVHPASPTVIETDPAELSLPAGTNTTLRIAQRDGYDNLIETAASTVKVSVQPPNLGEIERTADGEWIFKGTGAGEGQIRVEIGDLVTVLPASVQAGQLADLQITLAEGIPSASYTLISGGTYRFEVLGTDAEGNQRPTTAQWSLAGNLGELSVTGGTAVVKARYIGSGGLSARAEGIARTVPLEVVPHVQHVGIEGGIVEAPGGLSLHFPPGSLREEIEIRVDLVRSAVDSADELPAEMELPVMPDLIFRVSPADYPLAKPALLQIDVEDAGLADGMFQQWHVWDAFRLGWLPLGEPGRGKLTASIHQLGKFALLPVSAPPVSAQQLTIHDLRVNPPVFYAPELNRLTISYHLVTGGTGEAEVTLSIYDLRSRRVALLADREATPDGYTTVQWDGRDDRGRLVPNGRYVLVAHARTPVRTAVARKVFVVFK